MGHDHSWTPADVARLKELWGDGLSCSQIAKAMGQGLTSSAIIGKAHRLKLEPRQMGVNPLLRKKVATRPKRVVAKRRAPPAPKPRQVEPSIAPEPFEFTVSAWQPLPGSAPVRMEHMTGCKWSVGDPLSREPALFCNCPPVEGKPYCAEHMARSVGKGTPSEQRAHRTVVAEVRLERIVPEAA